MTEIAVYNPHNATLLLGTAAVILTVAAAWWHHRLNGKSNRIPSKWRRVGHLSELNIYPLKSGREMPCQEAECTELGLQDISTRLLDRTFMVYGETDGKYMTAARFPRLLLVSVDAGPEENQITFNAPECQPLTVTIPTSDTQDTSTCTVWWSEEVKTLDCGEEAALWFSRYLLSKDSGARLGHYAQENQHFRRDLSKTRLNAFQEHYKKLLDHDVGAYSYLSGFMLLAESSIEDLASRLPGRLCNLSPRRFRGNFLAQETEPYEEDTWDWVRIGDHAIFRTVKPCTRCTITTVDPDTAIRDPQMEPLKTLRSYRRVTQPGARDVEGPDPIMGVYLGLRVPGIINAGDAIYVGYD